MPAGDGIGATEQASKGRAAGDSTDGSARWRHMISEYCFTVCSFDSVGAQRQRSWFCAHPLERRRAVKQCKSPRGGRGRWFRKVVAAIQTSDSWTPPHLSSRSPLLTKRVRRMHVDRKAFSGNNLQHQRRNSIILCCLTDLLDRGKPEAKFTRLE